MNRLTTVVALITVLFSSSAMAETEANAAKRRAGKARRKAGIYHEQFTPYNELQTRWKITALAFGYGPQGYKPTDVDSADFKGLIGRVISYKKNTVKVDGVRVCDKRLVFFKDKLMGRLNPAVPPSADWTVEKEIGEILKICPGKNGKKIEITPSFKEWSLRTELATQPDFLCSVVSPC